MLSNTYFIMLKSIIHLRFDNEYLEFGYYLPISQVTEYKHNRYKVNLHFNSYITNVMSGTISKKLVEILINLSLSL